MARSDSLAVLLALLLARTASAHGDHGHVPEGEVISDDPIVRATRLMPIRFGINNAVR